jgi:hypothetical protein
MFSTIAYFTSELAFFSNGRSSPPHDWKYIFLCPMHFDVYFKAISYSHRHSMLAQVQWQTSILRSLVDEFVYCSSQ